jgi:2-succinyl-5-enolpyruvyl-6-hydroxy-3-cyclohexene-1-carboxylate synthase
MTASSFIDQLVLQGVTQFCIAPGSRSTPLVQAISQAKQTNIHVHYDERGLAFYALGIAKSTSKPVAIVVTSGTAVGNLLPAIMEAHHSCTPLIVLTADRPIELRECGANQATDQVKIFHSFVRWQFDLSDTCERTVRSIATQGVFFSQQNPPGPVHINCQFREPLYQPNRTASFGKSIQVQFPSLETSPFITDFSKGAILVGKLPKEEDLLPILEMAEKWNWPVIADILSSARNSSSSQLLKHFDWNQKPTPEIVLHFGERLTSKRILNWLKEIQAQYIHISPYPHLQDPERLLTGRVQSDISRFCKNFQARREDGWMSLWQDLEPQFEESGVFTEAHAMRKIAQNLPSGMGVFLGNGMPIRDADHFFFPNVKAHYFANRGLSGIDGNIATIAGLAEKMPIIGIIGDQTALYDLNSLPLLKKCRHPVSLVIFNNFGGGIFHHLPVSRAENFDSLWLANHDFRFEKAAEMFQIPYLPFSKLFESKETAIYELATCGKENYEYQNSRKKCSLAGS